METLRSGQILALLGLVLVVLTGWGRRRRRDRQKPPSRTELLLQTWGSVAGFLMILAGLVLMSFHK
jgi:LPXTG-motif cell wall-anchored protein